MNTNQLDEITKFMIHNGQRYSYLDREYLTTCIATHDSFGTHFHVRQGREMIAYIRFNWLGTDTVHVLDLVISPSWRSKRLIKYMLLKFLLANPHTEYLTWQRYKHNDRWSLHTVHQILRGLSHGRK